MANPSAPLEGSGRRIPFLLDPDNPGVAYLAFGVGAIDTGTGTGPGAAQAVVPFGVSSLGVPIRHHVADTFKPFDLTAVTTEQVLWTPGSGQKFRLLGIHLKADVETKLALLDDTGGTVIFRIGAPDSLPVTIDLGPIGILSSAIDQPLYVTSSASAAISGTVWGCED